MAAAFGGVIRQLRRQEQNLSGELGRVRQAIAALSSKGGRAHASPAASGTAEAPVKRRRRRLSAAARARISAAQKRRWAKLKAKG
jgi:hypothetical protein